MNTIKNFKDVLIEALSNDKSGDFIVNDELIYFIENFQLKKTEIRVYIVNCDNDSSNVTNPNTRHIDQEFNLTEEDTFITEAESQGTIYTLKGFQEAVNHEYVSVDNSYILFKEVEVNE